MKTPFMVTLMYFIMPMFHILIFYLGLKYIPWPSDEQNKGGNV